MILKFSHCAERFKIIRGKIRPEMKFFYYSTLTHNTYILVGWVWQSVRKFPIEIKTVQPISKLSTNLKFPHCPTGNKTICKKIGPKMTKIYYCNETHDIYIIMWDVGLSIFLSVRLLVAYRNQNQSTHIKAKHDSEILTLCRMF